MATSAPMPTHSDNFEAQFANLDDPSVAADTLVAMAARIEKKRNQLPPELAANKDVVAILNSGLPEVFNMRIGLDVVAKMTSEDFLPSNGVNALLTPSQDLGNGISARQHAVSGEVFLFPSSIPNRMFIRSYDEMPRVLWASSVEEGLSKFNRIKISGKRQGQPVDEELTVPALAA